MTSVLTETATAILRFVEPMPGFEDHLDFTLNPIDPDGVLLALRSAREPDLRFVLTPADRFFPDYRPELGAAATSALGVPAGTELQFLLLLTITAELADATANLRAPIVTAGGTAAVQVVLDDDALSMREPIVPAAVPA